MDLGDLKVNLRLMADGFEVTARRAGQVLRTLSGNFDQTAAAARRTEDAMHRSMGSFKSTVVTLGALRFALMDLDDFLLAFPKSVARAGGEFQRMQTLMEGLSKSSDELTRKMEGVRDMATVIDFAKRAPFEMKALTDVFVKLKTAGLDPAAGSMEALVQSGAKFGATSDTMKRAAVAIQQMSGKGVVSMEELRQQLGEAIPNAMQLMARGLGMSVAELTDKVSKGVVKSSTAIARMFAQMELDAKGSAERMAATFPGALEKLKTDWELFQKTVADQGFLSALGSAMKELSDFLSSPAGQQFALSVGRGLRDLTEGAIEFGRWLAQNIEGVKNLGIALVSAFGGSKLAGAYQSISGRINAVRQQQERVAEEARANNARELQALDRKQQALTKQLRTQEQHLRMETEARQQAIGAELERFNQYKAQQLAGLQEIRQAKRQAAQEEITQLRSLQADRARILAEERRQGATGGFNVTGTTPGARAANPGALLGGATSGSALRDIERQIDAQRRRVAATIAETKAVGDLMNAKAAEQLHANTGLGNLERQIARTRELIDVNGRLITQKREIPTVVGQATSAVGAFARSLAGSIGFAAAFYAAIEALVWIYNKLTKAAREAAAAQLASQRAKVGQAIDDDPKTLQADIANKQKELAELELQKRRATTGLKQTGGTSFELELQRLNPQIDALRAQINGLQSDLAKANETVSSNRVMRDSQSLLTKIEREADALLKQTDIFTRYRKLAADEEAASRAGNKEALDKTRAEMTKMGPELARAKLDIYARASDAAIAGMKGVDAKTVEAVKNGAADMRKSLVDNLRMIESPDVLTGPKKPKNPKGDSPFENFIQSQERAIQQLRNHADTWRDGIVTIEDLKRNAEATIAEMEKFGDFGKGVKLSAGQRNQAIEAVFGRSKLEAIEQARSKLIPLLRDLGAEEARVAEVFSGEKVYKQDRQVKAAEQIIRQLEPWKDVLKALLDEAGLTWEQFTAKLRQPANFTALAEVTQGLRDATKQLEDDLVTDDRERQRIITRTRIEEAGKRLAAETSVLLATGTLNDEQMRRIRESYATLQSYIDRENAALAIKTRTLGQQLADEWSKGMLSMERATARWADDFVDRLVDGADKVDKIVKDMVIGALKDMAKIKMKETMSGGIGTMLDSMTGSLGSLLGLKGAGGAQRQPTVNADGSTNVRIVGGNGPDVPGAGAGAEAQQTSFLDKLQQGMSRVWNWAQSAFTRVTNFLTENLTLAFDSLKGVLSQIWSSVSSAASSIPWGDLAAAAASFFGFANGGIMTQHGPVSLRAYANGGIANRPQLALFGEGSRPEAFVPLPDGKRIPVALQGGGAGAPAAPATVSEAPQVTVNLINQSGQQMDAKQGAMKFDGRQAVLDIVLQGASQPGPFRDSFRNVMNQK